jgi:thiol-disulfide isomerase/thioredoxin
MKRFIYFLSLILLFSISGLAQNAPAETNGTLAVLLNESFEGSTFPPSGWRLMGSAPVTEAWRQSGSKAHTGTKSAYAAAEYFYMDNWIVTPAINLTGATRATLSFYEDQEDWLSKGTNHFIKVSTTSQSNMSSFTTVLDMTPANHTIDGFSGSQVQVDLSAFTGNSTVYVAFQIYQNGKDDIWYVDDIKVYTPVDHDVMAYSLTMNSHYTAYSTVTPTGTVKNEGLNPETFEVQFGYYDFDDNKVYVSSTTVTGLAPGASAAVSFDPYTFESNKLKYFIETSLATDTENANDECTKYIESYSLQQSVVLYEEFTGTWCQYCPGVANTLDDLNHNYPDGTAIIAYHNGDDFTNSYGSARESYYNVTGFPTTRINGTITKVGGVTAGSDYSALYADYESAYLSEREKYTPLDLDLQYTKNGSVITIVANVTYVSESASINDYIFYALCESHIAYTWQTSMDSLHFVERVMYPDANGVKIYNGTSYPAMGLVVKDTVEFTVPGGVVEDNCEFIAFIQDPATKEVKNSAKMDLGNPVSDIHRENNPAAPTLYFLSQNYPNPFNPTTTLRYGLEKNGSVEITLFDVRGLRIKTLFSGQQQAGNHELAVNGTDLASGVYFYRIKAGQFQQTRKMVLVR